MKNIEKWRILSFDNIIEGQYSISNHGRVKNNITKNIVRPSFSNEKGVYVVVLSTNTTAISNKGKPYYLHRLVAHVWCDNPNGGTIVTHIDGDNNNNMANNLKWINQHDVTNPAYGDRYGERTIRDICDLLERGLKGVDILRIIEPSSIKASDNPKLYGVICNIYKKDSYSRISQEYNFDNISNTLRNTNVAQHVKSGLSTIDIMRLYGYDSIHDNERLYNYIETYRQ